MLSGLYTAASGMLVQQLRQEVISQNLSNINSPGYKERQTASASFADVLLHRINAGNGKMPIGSVNRGVQLDEISVNWSQGTFVKTNSATDLALQGDGLFSVNTPEGTRYARNGSFQVDAEGFLTLLPGVYLMGENGPIWVGKEDFQVNADGGVYQKGEFLDRLKLATFTEDQLLPLDEGIYAAVPRAQELPHRPRVLQGYVENSNIDPIKQMSVLIEVARIYESNQRVVQAYDQILSKSANEIGLLR